VWFGVSSPNGLPQPSFCDFYAAYPARQPIVNKVPTDTSTIATANLSLNMTGTSNLDPTNLSVSSNTLGVPVR